MGSIGGEDFELQVYVGLVGGRSEILAAFTYRGSNGRAMIVGERITSPVNISATTNFYMLDSSMVLCTVRELLLRKCRDFFVEELLRARPHGRRLSVLELLQVR